MDAGYAPRVQSQVHNFTAFHKQLETSDELGHRYYYYYRKALDCLYCRSRTPILDYQEFSVYKRHENKTEVGLYRRKKDQWRQNSAVFGQNSVLCEY